ncbi:uncharacterized protein LOC102804032 [Saccoglossus kowalevskii]|uniref:Uncharacterized protein LOC102804032 n=1 Tax=Saccoglossus kowalevskii TaxID=10224 RepID=A0ABM0MUX6_SACKO|nr:PREDICTED: uncharacterized protein LOC102804032 [Saccoglossus kowalevskii]
MFKSRKIGGPSRWKVSNMFKTKQVVAGTLAISCLTFFITRSIPFTITAAIGCCIWSPLMALLSWQSVLDAWLAFSVLEHIIISLLLRLLLAALQALIGVVIFVPLLMYLLLQLTVITICTAVRLCAKIGSVASTKSWDVLQPLYQWGHQILLMKILEDCVQGKEVIFPLPNKWLALTVMIVMLWSKFERKFPHLSTSHHSNIRYFAKYILHPLHNIFLIMLAFPSNLHIVHVSIALFYVIFTENFFQDFIIFLLEDYGYLFLKYVYYCIPHFARKIWTLLEHMPGFEEQYVKICYEIGTACMAAAIILCSVALENYESSILLAVVFLTNVAIPMGTAQKLVSQLQREFAEIDHFKRASAYQLSQINDVCAICWLPLETTVVITRCGHFFHGRCLEKWIVIKETCPLCNRDVHVST